MRNKARVSIKNVNQTDTITIAWVSDRVAARVIAEKLVLDPDDEITLALLIDAEARGAMEMMLAGADHSLVFERLYDGAAVDVGHRVSNEMSDGDVTGSAPAPAELSGEFDR
ncbi:MAG: hypothetical protein SXG53_15355 [Pseudomonadota bacterium]|nr:hypothetical protein [Pseudomonadota bacterium]